jgi:hypothetical protein
VNEPDMPARPAITRPLALANAGRRSSDGCAWRLEGARSGRPLGHAGFVHTI